MRSIISFIPALVLLVACQSVPQGGERSRTQSDLITQEELLSLENALVLDAKQVVQRLRPSWLQPRSSGFSERHTAGVFRDGAPAGGLEALSGMEARNIMEIRYLSASDATNRYGTGYPGGLILVTTKQGR